MSLSHQLQILDSTQQSFHHPLPQLHEGATNQKVKYKTRRDRYGDSRSYASMSTILYVNLFVMLETRCTDPENGLRELAQPNLCAVKESCSIDRSREISQKQTKRKRRTWYKSWM